MRIRFFDPRFQALSPERSTAAGGAASSSTEHREQLDGAAAILKPTAEDLKESQEAVGQVRHDLAESQPLSKQVGDLNSETQQLRAEEMRLRAAISWMLMDSTPPAERHDSRDLESALNEIAHDPLNPDVVTRGLGRIISTDEGEIRARVSNAELADLLVQLKETKGRLGGLPRLTA